MKLLAYLNSVIFGFAMLLIAFAIMTANHVSVGNFSDWVFGLLSILWLFAIVTVPWNIHFKARRVLAGAEPTRQRGLVVDPHQVTYVKKLAKWSFWIAIGLHVGTAIALWVLAATHVSRLGYLASVMALLLTGFRPAIIMYEYIAYRLRTIGESWSYPQQDVVELRGRLDSAEAAIQQTQLEFDAQRPDSLLSKFNLLNDDTRRDHAKVLADMESLKATNENEHERISREARSAISQLTTDSQFLDHVREILRFFKTA